MYTTEAQFKEHGIIATFKKQSPYPLTETQSANPLPTVLEVDGRRRYLSDIQLVEQELQSLTALHRSKKKVSSVLNTRPSFHPLLPPGRATSCGVSQRTSFLGNSRGEMRGDPGAHEKKQPFILGLSTLSTSAIHSSNAASRQNQVKSRADSKYQFNHLGILPNTSICNDLKQDSSLECMSLQFSTRRDDNPSLVCNIDAPFPQLWADPSDRPEVELGTVADLVMVNTEEQDEVSTAPQLDTVPVPTQPFVNSTPNSRSVEVDLHIGDLSTSCNTHAEGTLISSSRNKSTSSRRTPLPIDAVELVLAPLVVQSYTFPEQPVPSSSSRSVRIMPERNARIVKDISSMDCGTMTTDFDSALVNSDNILISAVGSELITAVTEQKLQLSKPHINLRETADHLTKQAECSRTTEGQQEKQLEEDCTSNISKQLNSQEEDILDLVTELHSTSCADAKVDLVSSVDTEHSGTLTSRDTTERALQDQHTKIVENQAEHTQDSPVNKSSTGTIDTAPTLTIPKILCDDIVIYRTEEDGTIIEDDLCDRQQQPSKLDATIEDESIICDDADETFLDSLNRVRRSYGIENAYHNFGAFLSNVSDFIKDCSISSATELPRSLSNDALRRKSLSSTPQMPDSLLPRRRSLLHTDPLAQLHKDRNGKSATTGTPLSKEQFIEEKATLLPEPPQNLALEALTSEIMDANKGDVPSTTTSLVTIEQVETPHLPSIRVAVPPSHSAKQTTISTEEHTSLSYFEEKPPVPPLELPTCLPPLTSSIGTPSPRSTGTGRLHSLCMQPPNTPHVPEPSLVGTSSVDNTDTNAQKLHSNFDGFNNNICLPQSLEPGPFKSRLPGFEKGSKNDVAISSGFETLKLLGYTAQGRGKLLSHSSHTHFRVHRASSTSQSSRVFSPTDMPGIFPSAMHRNNVDETVVGHDPNRLILTRSALEDLVNMSDNDLSVLRASAVTSGGLGGSI